MPGCAYHVDYLGCFSTVDLELHDRSYCPHEEGTIMDSLNNPKTTIPYDDPSYSDSSQALPMDDDVKRFYGSIIQNAAVPLFVIDTSHTVIIWNNALAKLTGKSSFQIKKTKRHWSAFYTEKRPLLADLVIKRDFAESERFFTGLEVSPYLNGALRAEGWFDNVGGKRRYLLFEASPIRDGRNEVVAAIETIKDITERKQAQDSIENQRRFFQEILEAIPNPVFYKDSRLAYLGCNRAFSAFFGLMVDKILEKTLAEIIPEGSTCESFDIDRRIIGTRTPMTYETRLRRCDGQDRIVLITKAPFTNTGDSLCGLVGTFVDVTEQRELDNHARKMSQAVEQSCASIVITDIDGNIEYVNPHFCKNTGYSKEEALGHNPGILTSREIPPETHAELWQTVRMGREWRGEFHNRRKNGEFFWEFAIISPLTDKDGRITGFLAVKEDITARKAAEEALAQSKVELQIKHEELEKAFEQVQAGKREWEDTLDLLKDFVILTDSKHRVRRCNRLLCDITGKKYQEVLDQDWRDLLPAAGFNFVAFNGFSGELVHPESQRYYDLNTYSMTEANSGQVTGFVISLNDTTEIHSITAELQRTSHELNEAQRAAYQQEKLASIGQLAAGVAHEINNPMGFISSNLSTLGKYLDKLNSFETALVELVESRSDPGAIEEIMALRKKMKIDFILEDISGLLQESREGADRVRRIVQDLKSFSHVDETECKATSVNDCINSTLNIARNEIKYVADVELELDDDLPFLKCFPQQLNQVFMNILVNAAHAMEKRGVIRIRTFREADEIIVTISDTGKGIAPEHLNRIFEPFFTTKEVGKGTGLGLSISYDIIKKHGGAISVESSLGHGSTFTIRLPLSKQCPT